VAYIHGPRSHARAGERVRGRGPVRGGWHVERRVPACAMPPPSPQRAVRFCPEHDAFGTPRKVPDITGGDGFDVMDARASVMSDAGDDWTHGLLRAAHKMRDLATEHAVHLALLMDVSAACGSSVIYDGPRSLKLYRRGPGVAAATLIRAGIPIVSQRDERTLALIFAKLDASPGELLTDGVDHYERPWYQDYFAPASKF
jgi:uncharacterized protein YbbK (DUF523 family)